MSSSKGSSSLDASSAQCQSSSANSTVCFCATSDNKATKAWPRLWRSATPSKVSGMRCAALGTANMCSTWGRYCNIAGLTSVKRR